MDSLSNQDLQQTNARLEELIASLKGGILVKDEHRKIVLVNQTFCDMFDIHIPPEQLIGMDYSISEDDCKLMFVDPDEFVIRINKILKNQLPVRDETLFLQDGRVFSRDYTPVFYQEKYIGHLWNYRDITENHRTRRRWERLLRFEEINREIIRLFLQLDNVNAVVNEVLAMTGHLLDVSRAYVFRFRENERILDNTHEWCAVDVKPEIENLKGLLFDELVPSFFPLIAEHNLIAPRHISELPEDLHSILEAQNVQSVLWMPMYLNNRIEGFVGYDEVRYSREWLPEEITTARIIAESYARAIERKQVEQILVKARDEAIRTAKIRSQFVANMSHEIRTPMTGIMGMLELLLETELDNIQHEFASEAFSSSSRLLTIINDILDFSKLDAGQLVLETVLMDLSAIVTEVKMTLEPQLKNKPVKIQLEIDPAVPYRVHGDATRLRQVLMNLAGNAIKFTHDGYVTIGIHTLNINNNIAQIRFSVKDTGIGLAEDKINHIFGSFVQADGSTTRKYGGTGLGLSISKQLVELMGGTISVDSQEGEGSTFRFDLTLPIAQEQSLQSADLDKFSQLFAIVVDSDRTARYVLAQQLENWGIIVKPVDDFSSLVNLPTLINYDVIFLRNSPTINQADLAHLTAHNKQQSVVWIIDKGITPQSASDYYLTWPLNISSLYNILSEITKKPEKRHDKPSPEPVTGRILVADDYLDNRDIIEGSLSSMAVEVDFVSNGKEAIEQLKKAHYDLILMDIQMPIMNGIEATKLIRQSTAPYRNIPILAITASVMRHEQEHYLNIGVNMVIGKPYSLQGLRNIVQEWLAKSQSTTVSDAE